MRVWGESGFLCLANFTGFFCSFSVLSFFLCVIPAKSFLQHLRKYVKFSQVNITSVVTGWALRQTQVSEKHMYEAVEITVFGSFYKLWMHSVTVLFSFYAPNIDLFRCPFTINVCLKKSLFHASRITSSQISWKIHRLEKDYEIENLYFHDQEK